MKKNIGVIFGGNSVEHEISIITAVQAMENIDKDKYNPIPIYMTKKGCLYSEQSFFDINNFKNIDELLKDKKEKILYKDNNKTFLIQKRKSFFKSKDQTAIDVIFPIMHGTNVEDGKLQGYFETLNIPYIGPTVPSGVIGQDKGIMKEILKANKIKQTKYIIINEFDDNYQQMINRELNGYPVIVKPATLGSSIGIFIAYNEEELEAKIGKTFRYDENVVIEQLLSSFEEVNISVRGYKGEILVSAIEKVNASDNLLSYEDKYMNSAKGKLDNSGGMASLKRELPAKISIELKEKIEHIAKKVYKILYCAGVIRIDMMIVNNEVYVNEVNNIPGSLAFYLWEENGISYKQLLNEVIEEGIRKYHVRKNKNFSFDTNVLSLQNGKLKK